MPNKHNEKKHSSWKKNSKKELNIEQIQKEAEQLKLENEKLKKKLADMEEILKNTQVQYLSLKNEFDAYQKRQQLQQKKMEQQTFEKILLQVLPILELFLISYDHLPEEFKDHKWTEGISIINRKIHQFLENNKIEIIPTVGEEPDETKHEIIQVQEVDDKEHKGKIVQEVKKGYIIKTENGEKVLIPAKVILWQ